MAALANGKSFTCGFVTEVDWKINGDAMTTVCPICKSPAKELPRTGDATGFDCPTHGKFKVANTIVAEECTRQRWEAALRKAKLRAKPWEVPLVMSGDLFW